MSEVIRPIRSRAVGCGLGFSVEFEVTPSPGPVVALRATWAPHPPQGRDMRRTLERYRAARAAFLADVQRKTEAADVTVLEVAHDEA